MNFAVNTATKGLGGSFKGVTAYLMTDKDRGDQGDAAAPRVGFVSTQNLPTDDAGQAWRIMARTAQDREELKAAAGGSRAGRKPREVKPVFHYALSWHPDQNPTAEHMRETALASLKALGLDHHQALIVQHTDEDRAHLHIVVNRVNPETGKLDPLSNNHRKLDRWADRYEVETGQIVSPERREKFAALERGETPAPRQKRTSKPRREWEAEQPPKGEPEQANALEAARDIDRAARLDRYKQAAHAVRERFRPEWAAHYRDQQQQGRALDKQQRATLAALRQAQQMRRTPTPQPYGRAGRALGVNRQNQLTAFYNRHRDLIWEGIPDDQRPSDSRAIVNGPAMRRAIENAYAKQRNQLAAKHAEATKDLQARHDAARQDAQRAAWKTPAAPAPGSGPDPQHKRDWSGVAFDAGLIAAAATAGRRDREKDHESSPQRDLDEAAARIVRPQPAPSKPPTSANESKPVSTAQEPPHHGRGGGGSRTHEEQPDSVSTRIAAARARNMARRRDPGRALDRERGRD